MPPTQDSKSQLQGTAHVLGTGFISKLIIEWTNILQNSVLYILKSNNTFVSAVEHFYFFMGLMLCM